MKCDNMYSNRRSLPITGIFIIGLMIFENCCGISVHTVLNRQIQPQEMERCLPIEYFDSYVKACNNCSNICWPNNSDISLCISRCPIYFFHRLNSSSQVTSLSRISTVTNGYSSGDRIEKRLYNNPLFWTSIISMTITIISIIILVILCTMRKRSMSSGALRSLTGTRRTDISLASRFDINMNRFNGKHKEECLILYSQKQELLNNRQEKYSRFIEDENYSSRGCDRRQSKCVTLSQDINPVRSIVTSSSDSELSIDSGFTDFQIQPAIPFVKSHDSIKDMSNFDIKCIKYEYDIIKLYDVGIHTCNIQNGGT